MNYFEKTGYKPEQVREDLTWEQAKKLPIYVITKNGNAWHKNKRVPDGKLNDGCYAVASSTRKLAFYFFEKAELNGMKGVKFHLFVNVYDLAKGDYGKSPDWNPYFNTRSKWVFISPDWKMYTMKGKPVTPKEIEEHWRRKDTPCWEAFLAFAEYSHDMRVVGKCEEHRHRSDIMSPATVAVLKDAGFDVETPMADFRNMLRFSQYDVPLKNNVYYTGDFLRNLKNPNRVGRRKKEISAVPHDFKYYKGLLGDRRFAVMEDGGRPYVFIGTKGCSNESASILAIGLKIPEGRSENYIYSELGDKKKVADRSITENDILLFDDLNFYITVGRKLKLERVKDCVDVLLENQGILAKTSAWRNAAPSLERLRGRIEIGVANWEEGTKLISNFRYFITPTGQKDRVFEETLKEVGFARALKAKCFMEECALWPTGPDFSKTTPYEQVGVTKSTYYSLKHSLENGRKVPIGYLMRAFEPRWDCLPEKGQRQKLKEFCKAASPSFIDQIAKLDCGSGRRYQFIQWGPIARLAGAVTKDMPIALCVKSLEKLLPKILPDLSYEFSVDLRDYYFQLDYQLFWLGAEWPVAYNEFHVGNILHCLSTIHGYDRLVNRTRDAILISANVPQRVSLLHGLQNEIIAIHNSASEAERTAELDKRYLPFKRLLKKNLEWSDGEYSIIVPDSLSELTTEGAMLHHCVGSYKDSVAKGNEGILFLRQAAAPKLPFFTIDVTEEPNGKFMIRQCHGYRNCNPSHELVEALRKWSKAVGVIDEQSISDAYGAKCHL